MMKLGKKTIVNLAAVLLAFAGILYLMYVFGWLAFFVDRDLPLLFIEKNRSSYAVFIFISHEILQVVACRVYRMTSSHAQYAIT